MISFMGVTHILPLDTMLLLLLSPTLCDPIDGSPPGSPVPGFLQARILEWVAISFSNAWKWKVKGKSLSCVWLFTTPWSAAYQAPPPMGFSRQEYWSGVPCLLPGKDEKLAKETEKGKRARSKEIQDWALSSNLVWERIPSGSWSIRRPNMLDFKIKLFGGILW